MIAGPQNQGEFEWCRTFLQDRGHMGVSPAAHILTWLSGEKPTWVVAFDDWMGATCMVYMASSVTFAPRALRWGVFNYAFNVIKRKRIFALVNSANTKALRLDLFLGFKEIHRAVECAEDGADIVFLEMIAEDWKVKHGRQVLTTCT